MRKSHSQVYFGAVGMAAAGLLTVVVFAGCAAEPAAPEREGGSPVVGKQAWSVAVEEEKQVLTDADKEFLVKLARQTLCWYVKDGKRPEPDASKLSPGVREKLSCFVTLEKRGRGLRGCIGTFERTEPLYKNVISRAIAAAVYDSRFPRVTAGELKDIKLEISVLTAPQPLEFVSVDDLLNKLRPEIDGLIIETRHGSSTFLPQVWEQIPEKDMFLTHLCAKHGAPPDCWKHDRIRVQTYQAIVFGEEVYGRQAVGAKGGKVGPRGAEIIGTAVPGDEKYAKPGKAEPGTVLKGGTILSPESDIVEL